MKFRFPLNHLFLIQRVSCFSNQSQFFHLTSLLSSTPQVALGVLLSDVDSVSDSFADVAIAFSECWARCHPSHEFSRKQTIRN